MQIVDDALARLLIPIARFAMARGMGFPQLSQRLKRAYLVAAEQFFRLDGKRLTDSRLHVLTGLQRKDIKALRDDSAPPPPPGAGPVARVVGLWRAQELPEALPLRGAAPSFESLVATVSRDIHPRTIQDELERLNHALVQGDTITLTMDAFVPAADEAALLGYLGANVGDHAMIAVENVLAAPAPGPHFERAAHYDHLTRDAVAELEAMSRDLLGSALSKINAQAAVLQARDRGAPDASGRFRAGAYVLTRTKLEQDTPE